MSNFFSEQFSWTVSNFFCRRQQQDNCAGRSSFEPARHGMGNGFSSSRRVYSLIHDLPPIAGPSCYQQVDHYTLRRIGWCHASSVPKLLLLYTSIYHLSENLGIVALYLRSNFCQLREPRTIRHNAWSGYRWQNLRIQFLLCTKIKRISF